MTKDDLLKLSAPFDVVEKNKKKKKARLTIVGFSQNDPLGVGGGLFPDMPTAYFEGGGWLLLDDLINNYDLAGD